MNEYYSALLLALLCRVAFHVTPLRLNMERFILGVGSFGFFVSALGFAAVEIWG